MGNAPGFGAGPAGTASSEPAEGSILQNSSDFDSETSSGGPRRFGDFHIFRDLDDFRAMRLVLEPAPLEPLSQRKGQFRKTAPISILKPVLGVPEDLETFIFFVT